MSKFLWIVLLALWILLGLFFCNKYLCNMGEAAAPAVTKVVEDKKDVAKYVLGPWQVADGNNFKFRSTDHIDFNSSRFDHLSPSAALDGHMKSLADYLKGNKDRSITVTGLYASDEKNTSVLPTLGLARATDVKTWMQGMGVPAKQIEIADRLVDKNRIANGVFSHGVDFSFDKMKVNDDRLTAIKSRLFGKPITLYFDTDQDQIGLTAQQRKDFADLNYYLDRVPNAKLNIGGHTDSTGNRDYNINLSQSRAEFVRDYLVRNGGVGKARMASRGYGPDKPVADNGTSEGRAKNRRVEVTLN